MTKVYLIRHAEAEGNLYRLAHGWYNSRVTDFGLLQIGALAERFRHIPVDAVYSSDLTRTMVTAESIYKEKNLPLITDKRLREVHIGRWEDMPWGNLEKYESENLKNFNTYPDKWFVDGAETFDQVRERMMEVIRELAARHDGQTIALFSHGAAIRTALCEIRHICPWEKTASYSDNTAVSLLKVSRGNIEVEFFNDSSHLGDKLSHFGRNTFWKKNYVSSDLVMEPIKPTENPGLYEKWHADAWLSAHGSMDGYVGAGMDISEKRARDYPEACCCAYRGSEPVGLIELDIQRGADKSRGHIAFYYVDKAFRGTGVSVQLLGHAVSVYRKLGREKLSLHVAEENKRAIGYYQHFGFTQVCTKNGAVGRLLVMEKDNRV